MDISLKQDLQDLQSLITSIEADMSLGCLSTTPTELITTRLQLARILVQTIEETHGYDATHMLHQSGYVVIAMRKYNV